MTGRSLMFLAALFAGAALVLSGSMASMRRAEALADAAVRSIDFAAADAQKVIDLRGRTQRLGADKRPEQDLIAQVSAALSQAGLVSSKLKTLAQQTDVALESAQPDTQLQYRRQTIRFTLEALEPQELGSFLTAWRNRQGIWTPTRIELRHSGAADTYTVDLHISAMYIADQQ